MSDEARVREVEERLGVSLPARLRERLVARNLDVEGTLVRGADWYGIERLFGVDELEDRRAGVPPGYVAIGEDEGGNLIVLSLADGSIAFCDHDVFEGEDPLTPLAASFDEFVAGLSDDTDLPAPPDAVVEEQLVDREFAAEYGGPTARRQRDGSLLVPIGVETRAGREQEVWRAIRAGHPDYDEWSRKLGA